MKAKKTGIKLKNKDKEKQSLFKKVKNFFVRG